LRSWIPPETRNSKLETSTTASALKASVFAGGRMFFKVTVWLPGKRNTGALRKTSSIR
jgi:hypothetical protein